MFRARMLVVLMIFGAVHTPLQAQPEQTSQTKAKRVLLLNVDKGPPPVAEVYFGRGNAMPPPGAELYPVLFALWEDGRVIWSENQKQGGAPYKQANLSPGKVREILTKIKEEALFKSDLAKYQLLIVDSSYQAVYVRDGDDIIYIKSSHDHVNNLSAYAERRPPILPIVEYMGKIKQLLLSSIPKTGKAVPNVKFEVQVKIPPRNSPNGNNQKL